PPVPECPMYRHANLVYLSSFACYSSPRALHSFPTRRSSDLGGLSVLFRRVAPDRSLAPAPEAQHTRSRQRPTQRNIFVPVLPTVDRKSTRLNSSHVSISYAVFCFTKRIQTWRDIHDRVHSRP